MAAAGFDEALLRPMVEQGILHLHAGHGDAGGGEALDMVGIEIRAAEQVDLAVTPELVEPMGRLEAAGDGIVPPVELHEVEPLRPQALQRSIDDLAYVGLGDPWQKLEVWNELRV